MRGDLPGRSVLTGPADLEGASSPAGVDLGIGAASPVARALLGVLWEDAEAAMVVYDQDHRVREMNPAAKAMFASLGFEGANMLGEMASEVTSLDGTRVYPLEDRPLQRALRGEAAPRETLAVRYTGDHEPREMVLSAQPVTLDDGSMGGLLIWHDVTESWHFAQRSRNELAQLGQLLEGAPDYAIIMLDPYGRVMTWSVAAQRLYGYEEEEAVGLAYSSFFDDGDRDRGLSQEILTRAVASGKVQAEGKRVRCDGSVFWAHASVTAMRREDGQLRGFVNVTHNVSERRATERAVVQLNGELRHLNEQLEQRVTERTLRLQRQAADLAAVNSELEAFSYSVSHDLRAPLRAMSGFAKIIQQEFGEQLPAQATHYLEKVVENAQQMGSLIDALLSFSRMQRQCLHSVPIDMTQLVCECWSLLAPARAGRQIEFVLSALPQAEGDRRLIQQVWVNLLDNAIKYTTKEPNARVEVGSGTGADTGAVIYQVRDNGAGFDMQYAGKIGQVFQRLHHAEDFSGTGIGLALVQRIVQRHGGRLSAVGEIGAGATFGFTLKADS